MKKQILSLIIALFFFNNVNAITYNSDPKIFITELIEDAIKTLSDKDLNKDEKSKTIRKIAIENVDIDSLGMYTLGDIRKTLKTEKLNEYKILFKEYFLKSLTSRLTDYSENKIEILEADKKNANYTIVKTKIAESSDQPEIRIDWRVYTKDPLKPLIRDLRVAGVSMAKLQKEEFGSILESNNNDINALFAKLEEFIKN